MDLHPRWVQLEEVLGDNLEKVFLWMQPFGGTSPKPTLLWSTLESASQIFKPLDPSLPLKQVDTVQKYVDSTGTLRVQGTPDLKGTQAYP
eukprot:1865870-Karenia_brevis.AAC.1